MFYHLKILLYSNYVSLIYLTTNLDLKCLKNINDNQYDSKDSS